MQRDEAIIRLREHEAELRRLGVQHLYLFGSTARGEAGEDSDVDLFFDYERGKLGLFELMDVKEQTSRILGRKADIMTRDSLHKVLLGRRHTTVRRVAAIFVASRPQLAWSWGFCGSMTSGS